MRVSLKWLKDWVDLKGKSPQQIADTLTARGLEVEAVEDLTRGFDQVVTAEILEKKQHPNADRLSLCTVKFAASKAPLEIVCGAKNMKAGDKVALAHVGAQLPNGMKIEKSKIRGVASSGMLCSETELGVADESAGIMILPSKTPMGQPLAKVLGRDDIILELGVTPNRGDCLSHRGVARELAAAFGKKLIGPKIPKATFKSKLSITTAVGKDGPQFFGCLIEGVKVGPSPDWVVARLAAMGSRSINNVVDATNLVLFELGHPVHAYDADRLEGKVLRIRAAARGEMLPLLDGTSVKLRAEDLVIADAKKPVSLAGVMGGGNSEVKESSTRVFLECAEFSPTAIRSTARHHQKHTDSSYRFERGVDPQGHPQTIARLAHLIVELAGGKILGMVAAQAQDRGKGWRPRKILVEPSFFGHYLGFSISPAVVEKILKRLEFSVTKKAKSWELGVPGYRHDVTIKEDLTEEVARSLGYDQIPSVIPTLSSPPKVSVGNRVWKAKEALSAAGFSEVIHYSFTSRAWLQPFGLDQALPVQNPLSEDQEVLVPALTPGLVRAAQMNTRHHFGSESPAIRLFELRPVFAASQTVRARGKDQTGVQENWRMALLLSGPRHQEGLRGDLAEADFADLKGALEQVFRRLGTRGVRYQRPREPLPYLHPGKVAELRIGKEVAGQMGLLHPGVAKRLKLKASIWLAELDWRSIAGLSRGSDATKFQPWSEYPTIQRDFALLLEDKIEAGQLVSIAMRAGKPLAKEVRVFDIYKGKQVSKGMTSVAVRVIFSDETRSLQEAEADRVSAQILSKWKKELGAELRS